MNIDKKKVKNVIMLASGMLASAMLGYATCMIKEMICAKSIKCIIEDM